VLDIQDLPALVWMKGHSSCLFVAAVVVVLELVEDTGCTHSVAQEEGNLG
jgi:hypothetical protein